MPTEERYFMACESDEEKLRAEYGPFKTAEEAEKQARILGWHWVLVYVHIMEGDTVVDVKTRFYQLDDAPIDGRHRQQVMDLETLRRKLTQPEVEIAPMSLKDVMFFAEYEAQMKVKP
jgi:translation initiation factor IF-1